MLLFPECFDDLNALGNFVSMNSQHTEMTINICPFVQLLSTLVAAQFKSPPRLQSYQITKIYPHDPDAFTQGLEYDQLCNNATGDCTDALWESTGKLKLSSCIVSLKRWACVTCDLFFKMQKEAHVRYLHLSSWDETHEQCFWYESLCWKNCLSSYGTLLCVHIMTSKQFWIICCNPRPALSL